MAAHKEVFSDDIEPDAKTRVCASGTVKFSELQKQVQNAVVKASWFDRWGEDCLILILGYFVIVPAGLILLQSTNAVMFALGLGCLGFCHHISMVKLGHLASHGFFTQFSEKLNHFFCWMSIEFIGAFPTAIARDGHSKIHHPHTNILGLGDSSTWKFPQFPCSLYFCILPLLFPIFTPVVGVILLIKNRKYSRVLTFVPSAFAGYAIQYTLYRQVSGLDPTCALVCTFGSRAIFMIPYIHVNVFQHIGLSMYRKDNRPDRLTQMSYGVLNLPRHPILDWNFGHSVVNSHIEHHLFPTLSDKMCLNVKPIVKRFMQDNGLPYFERTYANRLLLFINKYQELMVDAPPITEFVAVQ